VDLKQGMAEFSDEIEMRMFIKIPEQSLKSRFVTFQVSFPELFEEIQNGTCIDASLYLIFIKIGGE
jgi:hypothetical protein